MTASSTAAYQSCNRQRMDLNIDDVSLPPARQDEILAEFLADVGDVDLDEVGQAVVVLVEEVFVDLGARDELAAAQGEQFDEGVLASRQADVLAVEGDRA